MFSLQWNIENIIAPLLVSVVATILAEVGLVCVSILGFDTGKKIGKKFSNREVQQANIQQPIIYAQDNLNSKADGVYYNS